MNNISEEDLQEDFEIYGIQVNDENQIYKKCLDLCKEYNLSGEQLAISWLGFAAAHDYEELSLEKLKHFENSELAKKKEKNDNSDVSSTPSQELLSPAEDDLLAAYGSTPVSKKKDHITKTNNHNDYKGHYPLSSSPLVPSLAMSPSSISTARSSRVKTGTVIASFNCDHSEGMKYAHDPAIVPAVSELSCGGDASLKSAYNYMFEKLRDCGDVLDDVIYNLGDQMKKLIHIEDSANLRLASNESVWCVGRICCDSVGRLNTASVLLEADRESNMGATVSLDLSRLESYSLFPGQIVAVKGINTTGSKLITEDIVLGTCLPISHCPITLDNKGVQVYIACGPFTTSENLLYDPLTDLLNEVLKNPPHILILMGPLVDSSHPLLNDPMLTDSYDDILMRGIEKIDSICEKIDTQVMMVTNFRDICCPMVFPTPPCFVSGSLPTKSKIKLLSDPSLISIDGVTIALTTNDVLMHISKEEISFPPQSGDRFCRLARHLLLQQSFYPLYPPPEGFCLSLEQAYQHAQLPFTPHIMILPSDFRGFVKETSGCVIINPERLAKGKISGCFAKLSLNPSDKSLVQTQVVKI